MKHFLLYIILLALLPGVISAMEMEILYYGEVGCRHCDDFTDKKVPALESSFSIKINVTVKDILSAAGYEECRALLEGRGYSFKYFPVVVIGNNIYQGETEITENLEKEAEYFASSAGSYLTERSRENIPEIFLLDSSETSFLSTGAGTGITIFAVLSAGLADGINPCAFTVLLFFFSYLSLRQKSYSRFLAAGAVFILAVFVTYLAIGFGFYTVLGAAAKKIQSLSIIIKTAAAAAALVFAGLSIKDYFETKKISRGTEGKIILKLPDAVQDKIHKIIRINIGTGGMLALVFATGFIVSVLELACTGQIYLPTIAYILQRDSFVQGVLLLLLYNTGFIFPMLIIYVLLACGINLKPVVGYFQEKMAQTRLLLAFIFIMLAAAIWIF